MKCTDKQQINYRQKNRRRRRKKRHSAGRTIALTVLAAAVVCAGAAGAYVLQNSSVDQVLAYEQENYDRNIWQGTPFAQDLCVAADNVPLEGFADEDSLHAAGLFDLSSDQVLYGFRLYDRLYPASTTKIMTAYLALKYGSLDDTVTISEHATDFNWDEVTCGLRAGDQISLYDLLCGLLLRSGNDCGTAIAEHIAGSEEAFAELMNSEARALGATGTHFVNPHGLHDENHYTTAYDLYLIFNACIKDERFVEIISMDSYTGTLTGADGTVRKETWAPTNYYSNGTIDAPDGIRVFGGKTGTTDQAGCCVILYSEDMEKHPYISVIMGAEDKNFLYQEMNHLFAAGIEG